MPYNRGDVVIVPFPFVTSDKQRIQKARPALVVSDMKVDRRYDDVILAAITSRIPVDLKETEMVIQATAANGLAKESCIRFEFLMTVPSEIISRRIGELTSDEMKRSDHNLALSMGLRSS
jgi:mRNA interferase MazF